jgi:phosphatidylglycerophosphate synthase
MSAVPSAPRHAVVVIPTEDAGPYRRVLGLSSVERAVLVFRSVGVETVRLAAVDPQAASAHVARSKRLAGIELEVSKIASVSSAESLELFESPVPFLLCHADRVFEPKLVQALLKSAAKEPEAVHSSTGQASGDVGLYYCPAWLGEAAPDTDSLAEALKSRAEPVSAPIAPYAWSTVREPSDRRAASRILMRSTRKPTDGPVSRVLNRPLSGATSRLLAVMGVTPNMATTLVFALGFLAAWYAASPNWYDLIWAGVWFQLGSVWDGCDGEIARVTLRSSAFGAWYDTITDNIRYSLFIVATGVGLFRRHDMALYLIASGVFLFGAILVVGLMSTHLKRTGSAGTHLVVLNKVENSKEVSNNPFCA